MSHSDHPETTLLMCGRQHSKPPAAHFQWVHLDDLQGVSARKEVRVAITLVIIYYAFAIAFYTFHLGWSTIDSLYFATVTLATVGYGDVTPKSPGQRLFTCLFILLAISIVATAFGILVGQFFEAEMEKLRDDAVCGPPPVQDSILQSLKRILLVLGIGGAVYCLLEGDTFINSLYWSCITVTTVGYGDVVPHSALGKLFAVLFIAIGTPLFGKVLSEVVQFPLNARRQRLEDHVQHQLGDSLEDFELLALMKEVRGLDLCVPGQAYCSRAEFALAMLVSVGKVRRRDLRDILIHFDRLDADGSRRLDTGDLRG